MAIELIDTHCHLDLEPLAGSIDAVLARARAAGVVACVSLGTSVESSRAAVELARRRPMVRAAVGIHPDAAGSATESMIRAIDELAGDAAVVAIGEIGLDCYRDHAPLARQLRVLRQLIDVARRRDLPVAIHCRGEGAYEALLGHLDQEWRGAARGLIHCASGSVDFIRGALGLGFYVSFAGNVTFRNAHEVRELVAVVPDDRLLVETDAPFLAPEPLRGQRNEPAYVAHTAAYLARLRGMSSESFVELTTRNARRLLRLNHPS